MGIQRPPQNKIRVSVGKLHAGQIAAYLGLRDHRFMALRCGRRFGKTELAKAWITEGLLKGEACAWFAPQHMLAAEVQAELSQNLALLIKTRGEGVMRLITGGRLDFWSLENPVSGRSRYYQRVVVDEAAFGKDETGGAPGSLMDAWERAIRPTLFDYGGRALVCSNSAGKNPDNFFYRICTEPRFGFHEYHATTFDNPLLPKQGPGESEADWRRRQIQFREALERENAPLVFAQEHLARFVDWSGVAFFSREKLLVNGAPVPYPVRCDIVFAVIDTASKTGTDNDATAVTFFAYTASAKSLLILDWDITQIEGALLETWLPSVFRRLEELSRSCSARAGSAGTFIEDKNSGTVLLQQAQRRGWQARALDLKLTAMGKDERAISVSGYVYQGKVKYTEVAFNKTTVYKQRSANHLIDQIEAFRVGDKKSDREDDLLDTACYGIALALGNGEGF